MSERTSIMRAAAPRGGESFGDTHRTRELRFPLGCNRLQFAFVCERQLSATAWIRADVARVDNPAVHAGQLDTFPRLGVEVESRNGSVSHRGADIPISASRHRTQRLDRIHSANVGNSNGRSPMMRLLVATAFLLRGTASLPVGAAILRRPLIVSAVETIGIAAIVFGRTGDGRRGGDRQNQGCRGSSMTVRVPFTGFSCLVFLGDGTRSARENGEASARRERMASRSLSPPRRQRIPPTPGSSRRREYPEQVKAWTGRAQAFPSSTARA